MKQNRVTSLAHSTSASQVVHVSSNANNGANAGRFYLNSNNAASNANRNIGTRLRRTIANGVKRKAQAIKRNRRKMNPYQIANGAGSYWGWCKHGGAKSLWASHMTADVANAITAAKAEIKRAQQCK
jgi:hypothetical protein